MNAAGFADDIAKSVTGAVVEMEQQLQQRMESAGGELEAAARRTLGGAGHGRVYRHGGGYYRASAPGEAPAKRSGEYAAGWHAQPLKVERGAGSVKFTAGIASNMPELAHALENGGGGRAARPHFERILQEAMRSVRSGL